jgi:AhpD family alkylhydroperoxidase
MNLKRGAIKLDTGKQSQEAATMFLLTDINQLYDKFADKVYSANVLDKKIKELIALSCSIMADCVPCISHHYKAAAKAGATQEEISEALAISMSISAGSKRAKYTKVIDDLEHDKTGAT